MTAPTREEIRTAVDLPGAIILDVRTKDEVAAAPLTKKPYKHASCHLDDPSELLEKAEELMPDKNAPIIIFCRSGRRAGKAKELLEERGYAKVLNAGGLTDLESIL
ncbi:hypothetical protein HJC23_006599 [Cyclotella cryptica]|uniref:Rhodanese domain-containing protein n=1 Tax=Cyclotella cryptica TaxID=29204 RepID=A0ABD3QWY2_9STRA|eukprot:CCRYP_000998-RA/>CCRYP_000998-RA protein AED:0.00 eAED:0.00 QI:276/1/1/1/1/1/2/487/105